MERLTGITEWGSALSKAFRRRDAMTEMRGLINLVNLMLMDDVRRKWAILDQFLRRLLLLMMTCSTLGLSWAVNVSWGRWMVSPN
jgi:hypothetical protein